MFYWIYETEKFGPTNKTQVNKTSDFNKLEYNPYKGKNYVRREWEF
jgi:hypothetical protein